MSDDARFEELFHAIMEYEKEAHKKNQKRIKIGIHCLIWIPLIFLALLFATNSSKVIFLVLWIASLFIIASYLIYVEYSDFKMQDKITTISNRELDDVNVLIGQDLDEIERSIIASIKHLEVKKEDAVDSVKEMVVTKIEDHKETLQDVKEKVESKLDRTSDQASEEDSEPLDKAGKKAKKKVFKAEKKAKRAEKAAEKKEQKAEKKAKKAEQKAEKKAEKAELKAEKQAKKQDEKRGDGDESDS